MANSLNMDLRDKVVVLSKKFLKPAFHDLEDRLFHVQGGFGAVPFTMGTALQGTFLKDNEDTRLEGFMVERLATEEEIERMKGPRNGQEEKE